MLKNMSYLVQLERAMTQSRSKNPSVTCNDKNACGYRARKSRTTLQNKIRLKVLPEQLTLFVNTSVTFKKCIIQ